MLIGHYAPAFLIKKTEKKIPLWVLFIAVQLPDILWDVLVLLKVEKAEIIQDLPSNPLNLTYMPFSHGLLSLILYTVFILFVLSLFPFFYKHRKNIVWLGLAVISHWILDLITHRTDLPIFLNQQKVGLGLWNFPIIALLLELFLFIGCSYLYYKTLNSKIGTGEILLFLFVILSILIQIGSLFFPPDTITKTVILAFLYYLISPTIMYFVEKKSYEKKIET